MSDEIEYDDTCTLIFAYHENLPDRVLVLRQVEGFITHYMGHNGAWIAMPDADENEDEALEQLFQHLLDNGNELLPKYHTPEPEELERDWEELELDFDGDNV